MNRFSQTLFFVFALLAAAGHTAHAAQKPQLVGWVERVLIADIDLAVKAKLDTGAKTSSIDSEIIDIVKIGPKKGARPGEKVVFSMTGSDANEKKTFEREVVRYVRIKKKGGGYIRRPVIEMTFCIGNKRVNEEVNLANRESFIYPVLIGRNMLAHANLAVDASETFMLRASCSKPTKKED